MPELSLHMKGRDAVSVGMLKIIDEAGNVWRIIPRRYSTTGGLDIMLSQSKTDSGLAAIPESGNLIGLVAR